MDDDCNGVRKFSRRKGIIKSEKRFMRILIIANIRKKQGGITTQTFELADSLKSEGYEVVLVSTHGKIIERISGFIASFIEARKSDIIIGVGCAYYGIIPMLTATAAHLIAGKRILYNFHDGQAREFLKKYHGLLRVFFGKEKIVVATEFLKKCFEEFGFNAVVISNYLNTIEFKENTGTGSPRKVLWARSFEKLYRPDIALEGAVHALKNNDAEFHMFGGGSLRNKYKSSYIGTAGIIFHDFVQRSELMEEYSKYSLFINTSDYDNFPMSIVEAGMNGMLVLTSDAEGISSIYTNDEVVYFKRGDVRDFQEKLTDVLKEFDKYACRIENLKVKISGFTWKNTREEWISLIEDRAEA